MSKNNTYIDWKNWKKDSITGMVLVKKVPSKFIP